MTSPVKCSVPDCQEPAVVFEPIPVCELDGVRVAIAYLQKQFGESAPTVLPAPPSEDG